MSKKALGLLLSCFDFSPVAEDEFHDWYDTEHIPERQRVPGFLDCRRWLSADGRTASVATYDLASIDVLRSPEYLAIGYVNNSPWTRRVGWRCIKLLRMEGEQLVPGDALAPVNAAALLVRALNVNDFSESEVTEWFNKHERNLAGVPGVLRARLFRATASTHQYAALYHLESSAVSESPQWQEHVEHSWRRHIVPHERDRLDILATRYVRTDPLTRPAVRTSNR